LVEAGLMDDRPHVQFVLGVKNAMPAEEELLDLLLGEMRRILPKPPGRRQGLGRTSPWSWAGRSIAVLAPCELGSRTTSASRRNGSRRVTPNWSTLRPLRSRLGAGAWPPRPRRAESGSARLSEHVQPRRGDPLPLSVFIIAKNEADRIGDTIRAVRDLTDDLVLIDSGSTDGTVEIARKLGASS
jgi:hypothetical protein